MSRPSSSFVTLISVWMSLTVSSAISSSCPGMYPHPSDCTQFYQCDSYQSYLFHCPEGTLFDSKLGICNHAYLVNCQQSSSSSATLMPTTSTPGLITPSVGSSTPPETSSASSLSPGDSSTSLSWNEIEDAGNKQGISGEKPVTEVNIPTDNIIVTRPTTTDLANNNSESDNNNSESNNNSNESVNNTSESNNNNGESDNNTSESNNNNGESDSNNNSESDDNSNKNGVEDNLTETEFDNSNNNGVNSSGQCGSVFDCGSGFNNNGEGDNSTNNNENNLYPIDNIETEESSNTDHNNPEATDIISGGFGNNDSDNSGNPDGNNDTTDNEDDEGADKVESDFSVSSSSLYPCSEPGYFTMAASCAQFFVCKEVAPGVLSADMIHRCPPRYLFDPVTRLCQREAKVTCDKTGDSSLFYSGLERLVVKLTESELDTFFSQELTLPRRSPVQRQGVQYQYPQLYPLYPLPLAPRPLHFVSPHFQYYPYHGR